MATKNTPTRPLSHSSVLLSFAFVAFVFWVPAGAAVPAPSSAIGSETVRHVLPNGITVIIREDHSATIAAASALVRVGAHSETRSTAGIRIFVQELLLRGTSTLTREALLRHIEERGASLDTTVGDDYVELFATGAGTDMAGLLRIMGKLISEPAMKAEDVERVRAELLARATREEDDFLDSMIRVLRAGLFQTAAGVPVGYGLPLEGFADTLRQIKRDELVAFFHSHYGPANLVLSISGDVNRAAILRVAEESFGGMARRKPGPSPAQEAPLPLTEPRLAIVQSPAPQAWVVIGFSAPGVAHPDYPAVSVLSTLLGGGMRSRLFVEFRQKNSLAYEVGTQVSWRPRQAELLAYVQVDALEIEDAKNRILNQLERLKNELAPPAELERARRRTAGQFILEHQRNRQRAFYRALFEALGVGFRYDEEFPERVRRVTAEDIRRVARAHFQQRSFVVALPEPTDDDQPGQKASQTTEWETILPSSCPLSYR